MKYLLTLIISLSFAKTSLSQSTPAKQEPQKQYVISLPLDSWQIIFKALGKLTGEESYAIMSFIDKSIYAQNIANQPKKDSTQTKTKKD